MKIRLEQVFDGGEKIVVLEGKWENCKEEELCELFNLFSETDIAGSKLHIDMSRLEKINSKAVDYLLTGVQMAKNNEIEVKLYSPKEQVLQMLCPSPELRDCIVFLEPKDAA